VTLVFGGFVASPFGVGFHLGEKFFFWALAGRVLAESVCVSLAGAFGPTWRQMLYNP
jgi:hypothetical protein